MTAPIPKSRFNQQGEQNATEQNFRLKRLNENSHGINRNLILTFECPVKWNKLNNRQNLLYPPNAMKTNNERFLQYLETLHSNLLNGKRDINFHMIPTFLVPTQNVLSYGIN